MAVSERTRLVLSLHILWFWSDGGAANGAQREGHVRFALTMLIPA